MAVSGELIQNFSLAAGRPAQMIQPGVIGLIGFCFKGLGRVGPWVSGLELI